MNYAEGKNAKFTRLLSPAVHTTAAITSEVIDTQGYDSLCLILQTGSLNNLEGDFKVQHSDSATSGFEDVKDGDVVGPKAHTVADDDDDSLAVTDYVGIKRYVRVTKAAQSGGSGNNLAGLAILGHPRKLPVPLPAFG